MNVFGNWSASLYLYKELGFFLFFFLVISTKSFGLGLSGLQISSEKLNSPSVNYLVLPLFMTCLINYVYFTLKNALYLIKIEIIWGGHDSIIFCFTKLGRIFQNSEVTKICIDIFPQKASLKIHEGSFFFSYFVSIWKWLYIFLLKADFD